MREKHKFDYQRVADGLKLIGWGLFKKVVVADRLSLLIGDVYAYPHSYPGLPSIVATIFFAFQIYSDFSGYSDIAIGTAQVMGFSLIDNFNRPYHSASLSEFWKRWHISLSTWFRDYVYIPLGGNRVGARRTIINLFITFLLSGLWHGANWTFIAWGALHGAYVTVGAGTASPRERFRRAVGLDRHPRLSRGLAIVTTFLLVCLAWIFFRAGSIGDAFYIIHHLPDRLPETIRGVASDRAIRNRELYLGHGLRAFAIAVLGIFVLESVHFAQRRGRMRQLLREQPGWLRWSFYYAVALAIMLGGVFRRTQFIYFQF